MALLTRTRRPSRGEVAAEAVERGREAGLQAAEPAVARAREAAEPAVVRAREVAEPAVARAREASGPALSALVSGLGTLLRLLVRAIALIPGVGARVLQFVSTSLGQLADRSAEIADLKPPSRVGRRRRAALWFVGGFAAGAATGYAVSELTRDDPVDPVDEPWHPGAAAAPSTSTAPAEG